MVMDVPPDEASVSLPLPPNSVADVALVTLSACGPLPATISTLLSGVVPPDALSVSGPAPPNMVTPLPPDTESDSLPLPPCMVMDVPPDEDSVSLPLPPNIVIDVPPVTERALLAPAAWSSRFETPLTEIVLLPAELPMTAWKAPVRVTVPPVAVADCAAPPRLTVTPAPNWEKSSALTAPA